MSSRLYDLISMGLILVLGAAYQYLFLREGIGLIDEGHLANAARRVASGDVLYRDVYSVYPPASFYAVAALFKGFGPSLILVRMFHGVLTLACALAAYGWTRRMMAPGWAWLAGMLVATTGWEAILERCHYSYLYSVFPLIAMLLFFGSGEKSASSSRLLLVGAFAGLTLLFRLVPFVGLVAALAGSILLRSGIGKESLRQVGWMSLGVAAVSAPAVSFFWMNDALSEAVRAVFWTSFGQYIQGDLQGSDFNLPFPTLEPWPRSFARADLQSLWINWEFYLPPLIYLGTFIDCGARLFRFRSSGSEPESASRDRDATIARLAMAVFGALLFLRATGRSDYYHLAPVLVPAYLLGADFLARGCSALVRSERIRRIWRRADGGTEAEPKLSMRVGVAFAGAICILLLSGFLHQVDGAAQRVRKVHGKVALEEGGPFIPAAGALDDLVEDLRNRTQPDEPILVLPWYPILYFLAERENATRYDWLFPGYLNSEADWGSLIKSLDESAVRTVVYSPASIDGRQDRSLAGFAPALDRYLRQHFRAVKRYGSFLLMEKKRRVVPGARSGRR